MVISDKKDNSKNVKHVNSRSITIENKTCRKNHPKITSLGGSKLMENISTFI